MKLTRTMLFSSALSVLLICLRLQWSGNLHYVFLAWNLFLAWIPFICACLLREAKREGRPRYVLLLLFGTWLLFFPNSPYILTDLFHLQPHKGIPLWFDLVLILSFAWNGLLLGFISLLEVQRILGAYIGKAWISTFIVALMVLCGFGIYLGRYPRWNSWDVINSPVALFGSIFRLLLHPFQNTRMIGVTFFFSLFLIVVYGTLHALIRNFKTDCHDD